MAASTISAKRGVLLDIDGTLLDSNDAHAGAWKDALAEQGISVERGVLRRLIGMGADQMLPKLGLAEDHGPGKEAKQRKDEIFRERYMPDVKAQPGARRLVSAMAEAGLKRIVATSAGDHELAMLLHAAGVEDLIDGRASSSQAERSKPDPDIVHAAVARSGLPRESLTMLGDTPYDIAAAVRAGVPIVCVRCGGWRDDELRGAVAIYDDPEDLADHFGASPFCGH